MDILLDAQGDFLTSEGDLVIGDDTAQVLALLIGSVKGMWKEHPLAGIGLSRYIEASLELDALAQLHRELAVQLSPEGYSAKTIDTILKSLLDGKI